MADVNLPCVGRRNVFPRPASQKELISEQEHIRVLLPTYSLWQLGTKMTETKECVWRLLADKLGLTVEQIADATSEYSSNPGYGVIMVWSRRKNSTIGVLRKTLEEELKRADLVEMLDKARQSELASAYQVLHRSNIARYTTLHPLLPPPHRRPCNYVSIP